MDPQGRTETAMIGLLLSGGLDSCILLGDLVRRGHRVLPIYVDSSLVWQGAELGCLRRFLRALGCEAVEPLVCLEMPLGDVYEGHWSLTGVGVPFTEKDEAVYLPGRNAILLVKATLCCQQRGIEDLAIGVLGTSPFADARGDFFTQFGKAMNTALGARLRIHLPFADMSKRAVMQLGRDLPLGWTFSCVAPVREFHCGQCNKCLERQRAFQEAGMEDPTRYASAEVWR
ncbi:MAG: 7-cyano-7-deazaguanine synthase [Thermoguttaceae bacterium]